VVSFWGGITGIGSSTVIGTASANYSSNRARLVSGSQPVASARYTFSADGTEVTDTKTGLIWRRCEVGQTWNASLATCTSDANFPYASGISLDGHYAFSFVQAHRHTRTQSGWRIPNVKELKSIHEGTIDAVAFPKIGSSAYYRSSTIYSKNFIQDISGGVYWIRQSFVVDLDTGWVVSKDSGSASLRLVR
jgi:hypothetical protein